MWLSKEVREECLPCYGLVLKADSSVGGLSNWHWSLACFKYSIRNQGVSVLIFVWPPQSRRWPREGWGFPSSGSLKWPSRGHPSASSQNASHVQTLEPCRNGDCVVVSGCRLSLWNTDQLPPSSTVYMFCVFTFTWEFSQRIPSFHLSFHTLTKKRDHSIWQLEVQILRLLLIWPLI